MKKYIIESGFLAAFITLAVAIFCGVFVDAFCVSDVPTGMTPLQTCVFAVFAFFAIGYLVWWCWYLCNEFYYHDGGK